MRNLDHIKSVVSSQQSLVKPGGATETFEVHQLLDDALRLSPVSRGAEPIDVVRELDELPAVQLDRHKALQILINLLTNARDAVSGNAGARQIVVRAAPRRAGQLRGRHRGQRLRHLARQPRQGVPARVHHQGRPATAWACTTARARRSSSTAS